LWAAFNWSVWLNDFANDFDNRFFWQLCNVVNHTLADAFINKEDSLNSSVSLSDYNEAHFALCPWVVNSSSDSNCLANMFVNNILNGDVNLVEPFLFWALRLDDAGVTELVSTWVIGVLHELSCLCCSLLLTCCKSLVLLRLTSCLLILGILGLSLLLCLLFCFESGNLLGGLFLEFLFWLVWHVWEMKSVYWNKLFIIIATLQLSIQIILLSIHFINTLNLLCLHHNSLSLHQRLSLHSTAPYRVFGEVRHNTFEHYKVGYFILNS
jgi:hypothetical protein